MALLLGAFIAPRGKAWAGAAGEAYWGGGDILYHADRYMTQALGTERYAAPKVIQDNMAAGRIGLKTREGFLDYSTMDVPAYQRDRLRGFETC